MSGRIQIPGSWFRLTAIPRSASALHARERTARTAAVVIQSHHGAAEVPAWGRSNGSRSRGQADMDRRSAAPLLAGDPTLKYRCRSKDHVAEIPAKPLSELTFSSHRNIKLTATFTYRGREPGYPGPPAQIRTCALTHPAPALGVDGEALVWPRVTDGGLWPKEAGQAVQRWPFVAVLLRAPAQGAQKHASDRENECLESTRCAGDSVVVQPSVDDSSEPSGHFVFAPVHSLSELFLDAPEGASHPLSGWLAPDPESPSQGFGAEVRHAQKVEGFRFALPAFLSVCSRKPSELDEPGFVGMHVQPEMGEPFPQRLT